MSFCSCNKTDKTKTDGRSIEKQWNPYCTCELRKYPGIKKSETGIHIINLNN